MTTTPLRKIPTKISTRPELKIGDVVGDLMRGGMPVRFTAYDGSAAGPEDAEIHLELTNQRGLQYLVTAPGDLGLARAYVAGDLVVHGAHPGNPYEVMQKIKDHTKFRAPSATELITILRGLGLSNLKPPPPPPQEHLPRWRRVMEGLRHSMVRDAEAIHHHYDVSNAFYEMVLGPSMAYTCAVYPHDDRDARGGAVREVRPRRPQARPEARRCGCSTWAAAGAAWCATPPRSTASRRSASR